MGKYAKLGLELVNDKHDTIEYSYSEIESILGFSLPDSAKDHRPWWANDRTHVQAADGWLEHGWIVDSIDMKRKIVRFRKTGNPIESREVKAAEGSSSLTPKEFEDLIKVVMSKYYGTDLFPGEVGDVSKLFDMVSGDGKVAGDAKYLTMVRGKSLPPAKFSVIAEHVWLLGKTGARKKFLVFGNDRRVPEEWLRRYGNLVTDVDFFFYNAESNVLEELEATKQKGDA